MDCRALNQFRVTGEAMGVFSLTTIYITGKYGSEQKWTKIGRQLTGRGRHWRCMGLDTFVGRGTFGRGKTDVVQD